MVLGILKGIRIQNLENNGRLMNRLSLAMVYTEDVTIVCNICTYTPDNTLILLKYQKDIPQIHSSGSNYYYSSEIEFPPSSKLFIEVYPDSDTCTGKYSLDIYFYSGFTKSQVEEIITAELVNGQSIDLAIDTLIALINHNDLKNINAGTAYEHITQTQKTALAEHAAYIIAQHNRPIEVIIRTSNGYTAGVNNVYFLYNLAVFGITSKANNSLYVMFRIPSDYVAGDIIMNFMFRIDSAGATVDYEIKLFSGADGATMTVKDTNTGQYTANATANRHNQESETLDGSGVSVGESAFIRIRMEDNAQAVVIDSWEFEVLIPVNTRV